MLSLRRRKFQTMMVCVHLKNKCSMDFEKLPLKVHKLEYEIPRWKMRSLVNSRPCRHFQIDNLTFWGTRKLLKEMPKPQIIISWNKFWFQEEIWIWGDNILWNLTQPNKSVINRGKTKLNRSNGLQQQRATYIQIKINWPLIIRNQIRNLGERRQQKSIHKSWFHAQR